MDRASLVNKSVTSYRLLDTAIHVGIVLNIPSFAEVQAMIVCSLNQDLSVFVLLLKQTLVFGNVSPVDVVHVKKYRVRLRTEQRLVAKAVVSSNAHRQLPYVHLAMDSSVLLFCSHIDICSCLRLFASCIEPQDC